MVVFCCFNWYFMYIFLNLLIFINYFNLLMFFILIIFSFFFKKIKRMEKMLFLFELLWLMIRQIPKNLRNFVLISEKSNSEIERFHWKVKNIHQNPIFVWKVKNIYQNPIFFVLNNTFLYKKLILVINNISSVE